MSVNRHRLEGFESDNVLAFLALLGVLRALEAEDQTVSPDQCLRPRVSWDLEHAPVRPVLHLPKGVMKEEVTERVWRGIQQVWRIDDVGDREKLKFTTDEARLTLKSAAEEASGGDRLRSDLWAALLTEVSDGEVATKTPFCLLDVAQTAFLKNLALVCDPTILKSGRRTRTLTDVLRAAMFGSWERTAVTPSFRWDPVEDSRHALRWAAPTTDKQGVEHGANVLAAVALPLLSVAPVIAAGRVRAGVPGGEWRRAVGSDTGFGFAWPIWREPARLSAIVALLRHPELRRRGALSHLGVDHVVETRRISVGKYMNMTRARPLEWR